MLTGFLLLIFFLTVGDVMSGIVRVSKDNKDDMLNMLPDLKNLDLDFSSIESFLASVEEALSGSVRESNAYMDAVINDYLRPELKKLEPKTLPKIRTFFQMPGLGFDVQANYTHGELKGLSSVRRYGDCQAPQREYVTTVTRCTLAFDQLNARYELTLKYGTLPTVIGANARATIKDAIVLVEVLTGQYINFPYFQSMSVNDLNISSSLNGISTSRTAENLLRKDFEGKLSPLVNHVLYSDFFNKMARSLSEVTTPAP